MNENILRRVVITQVPQTDSNLAAAMLRLVLYPHELCRLPPKCRGIRVLVGQAWVTLAGEDLVLTPGEKMRFAPTKDFALVSALGNVPLIVEVQDDPPSLV